MNDRDEDLAMNLLKWASIIQLATCVALVCLCLWFVIYANLQGSKASANQEVIMGELLGISTRQCEQSE